MSQYYITIDCGTTNTRTILWCEGNQIAQEKREVGVRNTAIDGNNNCLKQAARECLEGVLETAGIGYDSIKCVVASGMITSNVGLAEIPHLVAPVAITDFAKAIQSVILEDVCPLPIHFIPGVKNAQGVNSLDALEKMDIMRGEEVECCAIIAACHRGRPMVLVLPGSHTKFVAVDPSGAITGCLTTISGELLDCITHNTIIADAVGRRFVTPETYDRDMALLGYETALKTGLGRACFSGRILNQFVTKDPALAGSFILGAVLQNDVEAIRHSDAVRAGADTAIIVAGKGMFQRAFLDILTHAGCFGHVEGYAQEEDAAPLSALGAITVARQAGLLQ